MRFNEFTHYWNKSTVRDSFILSSGTTPSRINGDYFNGNICWLTSGELKKKKTSTTLEKITEKARKIFNLKLFPKGTFVIATYGLEATGVRGTCTILDTSSTISQACMAFEPKGKIHNEFLYYWYLKYGEIIGTKYAQGTKQQNLSFDLVEGLTIYFPSSDEQLKICKFLDLLDQRIDTQSKIIEDLELFKNMISYKVLYDDKTVCYKPLSSFSELKNGYAFKSNTYSSKGDYQIVTIANVTGNRYIDLTSSNKILNIPNDIQSHQILKINDILISLTGNVGRVSYCNKLNCLLNQRVGLLSIKNKDLIEYIFQCIHNKIFEKTMISRGQGVAQLNIGKYDVESFEIPVYSQDRMNTISEVLKLIDFKIIKEKDILELYKKQKAYLLKNMFI